MAIWNILRAVAIFYDQLVRFALSWYIFSCFGIMYQEKSGNPAFCYSVYKLVKKATHLVTKRKKSQK
jgi:hypothetical protein